MKRIKNIQYFIMGAVSLTLGLICAGVLIFGKFEVSFLIAGLILSLWGGMNLYFAFTKKNTEKNTEEISAHQDQDIELKSSYRAMQITAVLLEFAIFFNVFLYKALKAKVLIPVAITLCCVLFVMLFVTAGCGIYYQRHVLKPRM